MVMGRACGTWWGGEHFFDASFGGGEAFFHGHKGGGEAFFHGHRGGAKRFFQQKLLVITRHEMQRNM